MLCRRCCIRQARTYATSQGQPWSSTGSKWARPAELPPKAPIYKRSVKPRSDPTVDAPTKQERTHEEVRADFLAKKKERELTQPSQSPRRQPIRQQPRPQPQPQREERPAALPRPKKPRSAHLQKVTSDLYLPQSITVSNLSRKLNVRLETLQNKMEEAGFSNVTHDHLLTAEDATLIAEEYHYNVIVDDTASFDLYPRPKPTDLASYPLRPPLVTIMGHVDHGKTTLLDTLRASSVAAKEAGGITQHIGAFSVKLPGGKQITFLDTPGHAAFESMRQRGASVTDIVVLVVAADDSVMPQTKEAIKHAQASNVNMIVAINKMDKPGVDPEKVKRDLMANGVEVEDFGGDIQAVPVSGLTGKGLDDLENAIVSLAEILDIRAETEGPVEGNVIESSTKKGRGNVTTMIVKRGTLRTGSYIVAGRTWCRVRAMSDEAGKPIKSAGPGTPVEVTGWTVLPIAGDEVLGASNEREAKQVTSNRNLRLVQAQQLADIEAINEKRLKDRDLELQQASGIIEVPFIVKADVSGSVEAITDSIAHIGNSEVKLKVIDASVGEVTDSDVNRAIASNAKILAFNVSTDSKARASSRREGIEIMPFNVIYTLIDAVRQTLSSFLAPIVTTTVLGEAVILKSFTITKLKATQRIAGCRIINGKIERRAQVRVIRNSEVVFEGGISSLRHVKEEVASLSKNNECGIQFSKFEEFEENDQVQCFEVVSTPRTL